MNEGEPTHRITCRQFAFLLAALICVSWPGILLSLRTFVYRDFGFYCVPVADYLKENLWHFQLPLWNPLSYSGEPFLAQWNSQALYPPALFYLLLPLPWSLNVFCLLHLFLGGLGMFLLARAWTSNSFGAAAAGIIFAFGGLMLGSLLWPATISALAWMPWVVWLTKRAWSEGGRTLVAATIVGTLQMLSGGVEVVLLTWVFLGALLIAEIFSVKAPRGKLIFRFGLIVLFISGLSAVQLLPFFDLLQHSQREGNYSGADSPMPSTGWANFLVPLFACEPTDGVFFQSGQYWIISYYTGVATAALAALALWRRPTVQVWLPGILSVFCVILAVGNATPVYPWFAAHVGVVSLIRFPVKFVILPAFALPLMAAFALAGKPEAARISGKTWLSLWVITVALATGCLLWLPAAHGDKSATFQNELFRLALFTVIIAGLFVLEKSTSSQLRRWLQIFVLLLAWLDLVLMPQPAAAKPDIFQLNMSRPLPAPQFGTSRAVIPSDVLRALTFATQPDAAQNFMSHRFAMFGNCNLLDGIPKCDGFFALSLAEQNLLTTRLSEPMLDFLGVSEVLVVRSNILEWAPRSTGMPLLTGGQKPLFADEETTLAALSGTNFNPRTEVYLPSTAQSVIAVTNPATVKITSQKFSAQEIDATVDASARAIVVAAQSYYHPWQALVDGQRTPIWRANYGFQALEMPTGTHQLKLVYVDWYFRIGAYLSLATLAAVLIYYWRSPGRPHC